jgi:hypothetical protein
LTRGLRSRLTLCLCGDMTGVPVEWRRENELALISAYYDSLIGAGKADPAVFVSTVLHEHPVLALPLC